KAWLSVSSSIELSAESHLEAPFVGHELAMREMAAYDAKVRRPAVARHPPIVGSSRISATAAPVVRWAGLRRLTPKDPPPAKRFGCIARLAATTEPIPLGSVGPVLTHCPMKCLGRFKDEVVRHGFPRDMDRRAAVPCPPCIVPADGKAD